jgi:glycosyltransferase involved in cell wall biosynthesis
MIIGIDGNEANSKKRVGVNQYAYEILHALYNLKEAKKHKWIIYLSSLPLSDLPKAHAGWEYKVIAGSKFWVIRKLMPDLWFSKVKPNVFFSPSHYTPPFLKIPTIVSIMDLGYLAFPDQFRKSDFYQLKYWGSWSMKQAAKIIAISESTKKDIISHYPWARDKVEVVYPGYDKNRFKKYSRGELDPKISEIKKRYGIKKDYILYLGTLKPSKNIEGLIEAYSLLTTDCNLVIAGKKGWLYDSIFEKVKQADLENKVIFTDYVSEEIKPYLLAGARVFVAPSFWEGFGLNVLEAMATGTPVVASKYGSLPEVVGNAGVLVNPYQSKDIAHGIQKVLENRTFYANKVLNQAKKFDWNKSAKKVLNVLEEAAK